MDTKKPFTYGGMRRFRLFRNHDASGVSGTGCVAQGVVFSDGVVAMRWLTKTRSEGRYDCIQDVIEIHGHGGSTEVRWEDPICPQCGAIYLADPCCGCDQCGLTWARDYRYLETEYANVSREAAVRLGFASDDTEKGKV